MKIEKIKISFLFVFAFVPITCILLEVVSNIIGGIALKAGQTPKPYPFDVVIIEQSIYFSVWTAVITSIWGFVSIINYFKKGKKIAWGESENVLTMVLTYNFISMLLYSCTMFIARDTIVGFNNVYSIIKSSLEHWIIPILLMMYYFSLRKKSQVTSIKNYAKHDAWKNMIIPIIYTSYVIIRCIFINEFSNPNDVPLAFPYEQVNPYNAKGVATPIRIFLTALASFAAIGSSYGLSVLFEFISIRSSIKFKNKFIINDMVIFKRKDKK